MWHTDICFPTNLQDICSAEWHHLWSPHKHFWCWCSYPQWHGPLWSVIITGTAAIGIKFVSVCLSGWKHKRQMLVKWVNDQTGNTYFSPLAISLNDPVDDVSVHLCKHKRSIVLHSQISLLDGCHRARTTAENPWSTKEEAFTVMMCSMYMF